MLAVAVKTHKITPTAVLFDVLDTYVPVLAENTIIALASKIISTCENNLVAKETIDKMALVRQEADACLPAPQALPNFCLTLKQQRLIPNAGLDESNCQNSYILLPQDSQKSAEQIWQYLRDKHQVEHLGVIITDSNVTPLRRGVIGIGLGWCGFAPVYDYQGQVDLFGRPLQVTQINLLDSLATVATLCMGEGGEQTPIAILTEVPKISFQKRVPTNSEITAVGIEPESDLFGFMMLGPAVKPRGDVEGSLFIV